MIARRVMARREVADIPSGRPADYDSRLAYLRRSRCAAGAPRIIFPNKVAV